MSDHRILKNTAGDYIDRRPFRLVSDFEPRGDQPQAIEKLARGVEKGHPHQVLLGITGSGKTFTVANVIQAVQRPALVIAPNKTLAAQLYQEFKTLFPENAVEYFVSYYDYYQPEAYIPTTDTYIEKDSAINEEIDKMRHSATRSVLSRSDVIIVASVSCIYGIGAPETYLGMALSLEEGMEIPRDTLLRRLVDIHYERNDVDFHRGAFRVRGDVVEVFPAYEEEQAIRIEFLGDVIESISVVDPLRGKKLGQLWKTDIYPASHYVTTRDTLKSALVTIREELGERLRFLQSQGKLLEAQRLEQRTRFDMEMLEEMGYCQGIENYSRHLTGRKPGEPPPTLMEYLPANALVIVDESHVTVPQTRGHVPRRPLPKVNPRRVWLPPSLGPGQPAAHVRRIRALRPAAPLYLGHPGRIRDHESPGARGGADRAAHGAHGPGDHRETRDLPGGRSPGRDPQARREGREGPRDDPYEAHGGKSHGVLRELSGCG